MLYSFELLEHRALLELAGFGGLGSGDLGGGHIKIWTAGLAFGGAWLIWTSLPSKELYV